MTAPVVPPAPAALAPAEAPTKRWWQSRTLWLNAIAGGLIAFEAASGLLQPLLPVSLYTTLAVLLPVANAVLRVFTGAAIKPAAKP